MSLDGAGDLEMAIARKTRELEQYKRKSLIEGTDAYNSNISVLTAELSILKHGYSKSNQIYF